MIYSAVVGGVGNLVGNCDHCYHVEDDPQCQYRGMKNLIKKCCKCGNLTKFIWGGG